MKSELERCERCHRPRLPGQRTCLCTQPKVRRLLLLAGGGSKTKVWDVEDSVRNLRPR